MAQQFINIGTSANKGDGEPLRSAFIKVNENFTEVYAEILEGRDSNVVGSDSTILVDAENNKINLDGTVKGDIIPDTNVAYDIGSATKRFKDLYLSGNTINLGGTAISVESGELKLGGVKIPSQTDLDSSIADVTAGKFSFNITGDDSTVRTVQSGSNISIKGGANITTASDVDGNITITGPDLSSYLTTETSHADVVVDGDFTSSGFMKTDGAGNYSVDSATYLSAITLGQVTGVDINDPQDDQVLSYNAGTGDWVNANLNWGNLTGTPTTLSGYGITDAFDGAFSSLTGKPTTVAGYGITDALTSVPAQSFASLTGKPTTISGYGITDAQSALVSGTSIKTINGTSLLGSGDVTISGGGGLADVVDDTTPQLGGNLDVNGNSIVSVSGGDINLAPNGAGEVTVTGNATISNVAKAYEMIVTSSNAALKLGDGTGSEGYMNIYLNNVSDGAKHIIQSYPTAGGGFAFQNLVNDQAITFETKNSSGTTKTPLILNGDGSVISGGAFKLYNYADATARDAALTSPEAGMMVYITDTNKAQVYNGTSWIDLH